MVESVSEPATGGDVDMVDEEELEEEVKEVDPCEGMDPVEAAEYKKN